MKLEQLRKTTRNNTDLLAEFKGSNNPPEPKFSSIQQAEVQLRISKNYYTDHGPIINSINNK